MEGWTWAQRAAAATAAAAAASGFFYLTNSEEARRRRTEARLRDCALMVFVLSAAVSWGALYVMEGAEATPLPSRGSGSGRVASRGARRGGGAEGGAFDTGDCPF